ncbi:MAG: MCE family protein [Lapillicoccus sp.]
MRIPVMKPFSERNPIVIAIAGLLGLALVSGLVFFSRDLPIVGGGTTYHAYFSEAAGLKVGNEVRIAGVKVGDVESVRLEDDVVAVDFRVKNAWVGNTSSASIRIRTALGQKYLAVDPEGPRALDPATPIPLVRTTSPFDVEAAFSGLATTIDQIDTAQLATSFDTLSQTFANTPESVKGTLTGLSALSRTISSRDAELARLVASTKQISTTLDERSPQVEALIQDGTLLLGELQRRRDAVSALLKGTQTFSVQVQGLVTDNQVQLKPALDKLHEVTVILDRNQTNLNTAISLAAPYYGLLTSATGNGRWLDTYVCGLFDATGTPVLDANAQRTCAPKSGGGS